MKRTKKISVRDFQHCLELLDMLKKYLYVYKDDQYGEAVSCRIWENRKPKDFEVLKEWLVDETK